MQTKTIRTLITLVTLAVFLYGCGNGRVNSVQSRSMLLPLQQQHAGAYNVVLLNGSGELKQGVNNIILQFHKMSDDSLADVRNVQVTNSMKGVAGAMAKTTVTSPAMPGYYLVDIDFPKAGKWATQISFADNQQAKFEFDVK